MTRIEEFEAKHNVKFVLKNNSKFMVLVGVLLKPFVKEFMTEFWTTVRLPFHKAAMIAYPSSVENPLERSYEHIVEHELVHARQQSTTFGLFKTWILYLFFPLPFLFSGRWFIEREAYLVNIRAGLKIEKAVDLLWHSYLFPWPRSLMRAWFIEKIGSDDV